MKKEVQISKMHKEIFNKLIKNGVDQKIISDVYKSYTENKHMLNIKHVFFASYFEDYTFNELESLRVKIKIKKLEVLSNKLIKNVAKGNKKEYFKSEKIQDFLYSNIDDSTIYKKIKSNLISQDKINTEENMLHEIQRIVMENEERYYYKNVLNEVKKHNEKYNDDTVLTKIEEESFIVELTSRSQPLIEKITPVKYCINKDHRNLTTYKKNKIFIYYNPKSEDYSNKILFLICGNDNKLIAYDKNNNLNKCLYLNLVLQFGFEKIEMNKKDTHLKGLGKIINDVVERNNSLLTKKNSINSEIKLAFEKLRDDINKENNIYKSLKNILSLKNIESRAINTELINLFKIQNIAKKKNKLFVEESMQVIRELNYMPTFCSFIMEDNLVCRFSKTKEQEKEFLFLDLIVKEDVYMKKIEEIKENLSFTLDLENEISLIIFSLNKNLSKSGIAIIEYFYSKINITSLRSISLDYIKNLSRLININDLQVDGVILKYYKELSQTDKILFFDYAENYLKKEIKELENKQNENKHR